MYVTYFRRPRVTLQLMWANCFLLPETIVNDRCVYDVMTAETSRCRRP